MTRLAEFALWIWGLGAGAGAIAALNQDAWQRLTKRKRKQALLPALPAEVRVLGDVRAERFRQDSLKAAGKFPWTCADSAPDASKLAVLAEEFGEVSREVAEGLIDVVRRDPMKLREELVQVAAVCVAWAESLDKEIGQ